MQDKIYINTIRYKRELHFECECNCMSIKNTQYFPHNSLEGQLKHGKNLIYEIYFMQRTLF